MNNLEPVKIGQIFSRFICILKKVPVQTKNLTGQGISMNKTRLAKFISFYFPFISGQSEKILEQHLVNKFID